MSTLLFYEQGHRYELDGKEIPSVTQLTEIYSTVMADPDSDLELTFEVASERGTILHGYMEHRLNGGTREEYELPPVYGGYADGIDLLLQEHVLDPVFVETPMFEDDHFQFAGKPDYVGFFDGILSILDWKFVSQVQKTKIGAQLNGYLSLCAANGFYPDKMLCVQFLQDGTYRLYPVSISEDSFLLCCRVYQEKHKKHPRGGIA